MLVFPYISDRVCVYIYIYLRPFFQTENVLSSSLEHGFFNNIARFSSPRDSPDCSSLSARGGTSRDSRGSFNNQRTSPSLDQRLLDIETFDRMETIFPLYIKRKKERKKKKKKNGIPSVVHITYHVSIRIIVLIVLRKFPLQSARNSGKFPTNGRRREKGKRSEILTVRRKDTSSCSEPPSLSAIPSVPHVTRVPQFTPFVALFSSPLPSLVPSQWIANGRARMESWSVTLGDPTCFGCTH